MKVLNYISLPFCLLVSFPTVNAQNFDKKFDWGKIPAADRRMTSYEFDPTADALVLAASTKLLVEIKDDKAQMTVSVYRRVKLFTEAALISQKNLEIPFDFTQNQFKISKLDAQLTDAEGNHQTAEAVENTKINGRYIVFNNLKVQNILEVTYEITSDNLESISNWPFQEGIPVQYAELSSIVDKAFEHTFLLKNEKNIRTSTDPTSGAKVFSATNLTANKPATEAFSITTGDQVTGVNLQLKSVEIAEKGKKTIVSSWSELANRVFQNAGIGQQYSKKINYDDIWEAMQPSLNAAKTDEVKIKAAYNFINENVAWDGNFHTTACTTLNAAFDKKSANSGELNLMLIACLNEAGFKAYPMLVSTRQHGKTNETTPFLSQFNHLLCYVERPNATPLLLDGGSIYRPMGLPRVESLNGNGWILNSKNGEWKPMPSKITARQTLSAFSLNKEGDMKGRFVKTSKDHEAISERDEQVRRREVKSFEKQYLGIRIDSVTNSNSDNSAAFFKRNIYCFLSQMSAIDSGKMTIKPLWRTGFELNPLLAVPANSAIDFPYPIQEYADNFPILLKIFLLQNNRHQSSFRGHKTEQLQQSRHLSNQKPLPRL